MRNFIFKNRLYLFLILFFVGCEEKIETEQSSDSLIGYWIDPQISDSLVTYSKSNELVENNYGIAFHSDGTFIERKNSGWCGTPPISFSDFEGSWTKTDSLITIVVDYWGGTANYRWKMIDKKDDKLVIYQIYEEYDYEPGE
jgi:hypothetical protein